MSELPAWARRGRSGWRHAGQERPPFALEPGPGQESVWDYPRPPQLVRDARRVIVRAGSIVVADSISTFRLLETASPPTFYIPPADVDLAILHSVNGASRCEWKGEAGYFDIRLSSGVIERCAWSYAHPFPPFELLADCISFYPAVLECSVAGETVRPQSGGFYGGWVTPEIVGPFKGEPGTGGW